MGKLIASLCNGAANVLSRGRELMCTAPIARRAVVLLLLLAGVKLALLGNLANHLYHTHWRIADSLPNFWVDFNFAIFLGLLGAAFALLGHSLVGVKAGAIRALNSGLGGMALVFVVLNFKRMDLNYLYPVMTGVLDWSDIGHYLVQDTFFGPPFLAIYLFAYGLLYWILTRSGREHMSIYVFGGLALLYFWLNLRPLAAMELEILVLNCVGSACLLSWALRRKPLHWLWLLAPVTLAVVGWGLFAMVDPSLRMLQPCLVILLALGLALTALAYVLARRSPAFTALSHLLPFYLATFWLLTNRNYPYGRNFGHLLAYGMSLPHYLWQELVWIGFLWFLCSWIYRQHPRLAIGCFDGLALGTVLFAWLDFKVTQKMGVRLDWQALAMNTDPVLLWRTIQSFVGMLLLGVLLMIGLYYGLVAGWRRWQVQSEVSAPSTTWGSFTFHKCLLLLLACATPWLSIPDKAEALALANVIQTSPLWESTRITHYDATEFAGVAQALGYGSLAQNAQPPPPTRSPANLNVVLILMESSHNRYLSLFGAEDETQPLLKKYRDRMELFPNFYANWPCSINARFSLFSGLYAPNAYAMDINPQIKAVSLFDILQDKGCFVSLFYSSHGDYQRFNDYLRRRKIDLYYEAANMPGREQYPRVAWGVSETATMEAITRQLARHHEQKERFFLTYIPAAPHMPYDSPSQEFEKFGDGFGALNGDYSGRYKDQLLFMDWIITRILDELERTGLLDQTLVIITNDHGEMVGDNEGKLLGHGWSLAPYLANVPLVILNPMRQGYSLNYALGSQVDILPTTADLLGIPLPPGQFYQGASLYDEKANQSKIVYLNSHQQRGMIQGSRYWLELSARKGQSSPATEVYEIQHEGARTVFQRLNETADITQRLDLFNEFQRSLLVHYASFQQYLKPVPASLAVSVSARE